MEAFLLTLILALAAIGAATLISKLIDFLLNYSDYKAWKKRNNK